MYNLIDIDSAEIMVIDDTVDSLKLLVNILKNHGFKKVRAANSGEMALGSILTKHPDLILLDVRMQGIDGFEVCKILKADKLTEAIPIIFITALDDLKNKIQGFEAGAVDFITKPYEGAEVLARISTQLEIALLRRNLELTNRNLNKEIIQHKSTTDILFNERELFKLTLLSIGDGVICTDHAGKITMMNLIAEALTGWDDNQWLGKDFEDIFKIINESTREICVNPVNQVLATGKTIDLANHTILVARNGHEIPIADSCAPIIDQNGDNIGAVLVFRDVSVESNKQKEIEFLSFHDQLTNLYNRRFFEQELQRLDNNRRLPISLIMGDLNGLKLANDTFGHNFGDQLIKSIASILKLCCRQDDIICRYGGDEFVILLPNTTSELAENIVERILLMVQEKHTADGLLSISFGWATKSSLNEDIHKVLKSAEDHMYRNKLTQAPSVRSTSIRTIMNTLYEKSPREEKHSKRVSELCVLLAHELKLSPNEIESLKTAGMLHDIGKITLQDSTLNKPARLDEHEWFEVKKHPEIGFRILKNTPELTEIAQWILEHHERWDGTGYPQGLQSNNISLQARIISIADAFDAMTSDRPYRQHLSLLDALAELKRGESKQFDPRLVQVFLNIDSSKLLH